jgi:hypothetical protein
MLPFLILTFILIFIMICFELEFLRLIFYDDLMLLIVDCVVNNMSIEKVSYTATQDFIFK